MSWFQSDPRRFEKEVQLMMQGSQACLRQSGDHVFWVEDLIAKTGQPYRLIIDYPDRFPYEMPRAYVANPAVDGAPHRFADGSLCMFDNPGACNPKITALVIRNRAVLWFLAYEVWRVSGVWEPPGH